MTLVVGPEFVLAQLATSIAFADDGTLPSRIRLYADAGVATGAAPVGEPLVEIVLARPCGTIAAGEFTLHVADAAGSMVMTDGTPRAARWISGAGKLVGAGTVTGIDGAGDFRIEGGIAAPGDPSPKLYAGGRVLLGAVVLD